MKAAEFYRILAESLDITIDDSGGLSTPKYVGNQPLMVETDGVKKRLFMPTTEVLRDYDKDRQVMFHPLSEFITIGESEVFKVLKLSVRLALITRISALAEAMAIIGTDTSLHSRMNPSQIRFLESVAGIDDKSVAKFRDVLGESVTEDPTKTLVSIFMTRDDTLGDTKYPRVCNITFPLMGILATAHDTTDGSRKVFNVDARKKTPDDVKIWMGLLNYILPDIETKGHYSRGSDHYAPYLASLLESYYAIQSQLNLVISEFNSFLTTTDSVKLVDLKWYGVLKTGTVINDLPNFNGNKGGMIEANKPSIPAPLHDSRVGPAGGGIDDLVRDILPPISTNLHQPLIDDSEDGGISVAEWRRMNQRTNTQPQPGYGGHYQQPHYRINQQDPRYDNRQHPHGGQRLDYRTLI